MKVVREPLCIDRRAGDDQTQFWTPVNQLGKISHEHIDLNRSLVGFVDDNAIVSFQESIALDLGQEDPVGHEFHERGVLRAVLEADLVADDLAELGIELFGEPVGDRPCSQPARLCVTDPTVAKQTGL